MTRAFIGLGSNLGNGRRNILAAWSRLDELEGVRCITLSSPYLTEPVNMETTSWFMNAVGLVETDLAPEKLLARMLAIEADMGRDRTQTKDRPVDLDLLYYDALVYDSPDLVVPHPEISNRLFVLAPLAEIAPDFVHPVRQQTTFEMLEAISREKSVIKKTWHEEGEIR